MRTDGCRRFVEPVICALTPGGRLTQLQWRVLLFQTVSSGGHDPTIPAGHSFARSQALRLQRAGGRRAGRPALFAEDCIRTHTSSRAVPSWRTQFPTSARDFQSDMRCAGFLSSVTANIPRDVLPPSVGSAAAFGRVGRGWAAPSAQALKLKSERLIRAFTTILVLRTSCSNLQRIHPMSRCLHLSSTKLCSLVR
ncbi:hypothetical protein OH77DRAFT_863107 [Trametes cingulata]|nr:hypothetical protein OH77DRAFT_863107 [Trametes cingulata]